MRRYMWLGLAACAAIAAGSALWSTRTTHAGGPVGGGKGGANGPAHPLPIRQVVLFNSGVGYLQREGEVDGDAKVDLTFPTTDINDLLKSIVLQDLGGGKISAVSYDSHDPIDKILRSFAIDLNNNPTFGQILNQARGEKVELVLTSKDKAIPARIQGTVVGLEVKQVCDDKKTCTVEMVNLMGSEGLQSIPLDQVLGVKFLNPTLEAEFNRALKVLAGSHDTQKKQVTVGFSGAGKRPVRVGYVVERPIWKTTYRLRMEPGNKISLQGWALVENTSDDDWNDVRMVLVSGKPISFRMNLYEPLYIPRPEVEPDQFASLRPPVYAGAMNPNEPPAPPAIRPQGGAIELNLSAIPAPGLAGQNQKLQQQLFFQNQEQQLRQTLGNVGNTFGLNVTNQAGANPYQDQNYRNNFNIDAQKNKLTYEELQNRRAQLQNVKKEAAERGASVAMNFKEGIQSVASAEEVGDYFQYAIDQKITLSRQKSAMLPILDQTIEGAKLSIFNESVHGKYPLLGLRLKNTSKQPLTQGPISVYDEATYAGDTRILDLQPGEERLLSYALDQAVEVKSTAKATPSPSMTFRIGDSALNATFQLRETRTYVVKNRSPHDRMVVIEHPIRKGWKLIEPTKAQEQTRSLYRFEFKVAAGETKTFQVVEDEPRVDVAGLQTGGQPLYVGVTGIQVKALAHVDEEKIVKLRAIKGLVVATHQIRETKSLFVQNLSDVEREFTVDHVVRKDWSLVSEKDPVKGPEVFRFVLKADKGKTTKKDVVEEKIYDQKPVPASALPEAKLVEYANHPAASPAMKKGLAKTLELMRSSADLSKKLADAEKALKAIGDDQTRVRENLRTIPTTAEPYKRFLEKFVTQEAEIETLQRLVRTTQADLAAVQRDQTAFLAAWTDE